jgi:hypothetical protein
MRVHVDVNSDIALALRALQKYDAVGGWPGARLLVRDAKMRLGELLGLRCTGGALCPVHEWLVPDDANHAASASRAG